MKKLLSVALILVLVLSLCACAANNAEPVKNIAGEDGELVVLKVGATPAPHAEILKDVVKPMLLKNGIDLQVEIFTDYVLPNTALDEGDLDANFFQHLPYLQDFNAKNGTKLVSIANVHFEPLGIYAGKSSDIAAIAEGAQIAVPNDTTNEARALQLLAANGVITLKEGVGLEATVIDIAENPKNVEIVELEAAQVPRALADVDFAIANGNYALEAGITDKLLTTESKDAEGAKTYANILAVREGDENREELKLLVEALTSEEVRTYIEQKYGSNVIPVF